MWHYESFQKCPLFTLVYILKNSTQRVCFLLVFFQSWKDNQNVIARQYARQVVPQSICITSSLTLSKIVKKESPTLESFSWDLEVVMHKVCTLCKGFKDSSFPVNMLLLVNFLYTVAIILLTFLWRSTLIVIWIQFLLHKWIECSYQSLSVLKIT